MSLNCYCCFCNRNIINDNEALFAGDVYSEEYKANFFQQNQSCEKCCNILNTKNSYFVSTQSIEMKDDAMTRLKELGFFIPKIDKDVLQRFIQMLVGLDQYSFAFSSKKAFNLINLKQLMVAKDMVNDGEKRFMPYFENSNIFVTQKFGVRSISLNSNVTRYLYHQIFDSISARQLIINAKIIALDDLQITADIFYQLLSPQLVKLECYKVKFTTLLNPINFIKKIPNIEKIIFSDTSHESFWYTEKIYQFQGLPVNCQDLQRFCLPFKSLNLTLHSFTDVMKKWSRNQRAIFVYIHDPDDEFLIDSPFDNYIQVSYNSLMEANKSETKNHY